MIGIVSIIIAMSGSIIIAWGDIKLSTKALYGDFLSLLGTLAVAVHMLFGQDLCKKIPTSVYSFCVFTIGGFVLLIYNIVKEVSLIHYSVNDWGIFLLLALVPNILGYTLFNWLLKYLDASTISMSILGEPIGAIILAYIFLGETTSISQMIGGVLSLIGVSMFLRNKGLSRKENTASDLVKSANT
ncbi:DMT family transporter [Bacillus smithii]|uniref:DMT family transporter n=1 Tax=Bacillus smithii TaxID=1479 RepID=UPI003D261A12